jgi:hypothetical protein
MYFWPPNEIQINKIQKRKKNEREREKERKKEKKRKKNVEMNNNDLRHLQQEVCMFSVLEGDGLQR